MQESNFHDYPILRMDEMPLIEVFIVESDNSPAASAKWACRLLPRRIGNAVFAATGKRIRHIPIKAEDLKA